MIPSMEPGLTEDTLLAGRVRLLADLPSQVVLHDLREESPTYGETQVLYLGEQNMQCLVIPPRVAHGYRVLGTEPMMMVYYVTQSYNPQNPDEHRIRWDDPAIGFDWSTQFR